MGATNCPETPRQRMIGMMYLVLTALLALNVSKDILNAFIVVNESIEYTNENIKKKVDGVYGEFKSQNSLNEAKVGKWYKKALYVKKNSDKLIDYINDVKVRLIAHTDGISKSEAKGINLKDVKKKDNYDKPTFFFLSDSDNGERGEGIKLKKEIDSYRKEMLELIGSKDDDNRAVKGLETVGGKDMDGNDKNWQMHNFYHTILVADVTLLNKMIAEVKNFESDVVSNLFAKIQEEDIPFNKIAAAVVPSSRYVMQGETYEADIFVAAYDSTKAPIVEIGGNVISAGEGGKITYKVTANSPGEKKYSGTITITDNKGNPKTYNFSQDYIVMPPSASISATKMNVFYMGLDNPVSVAVSGVPQEKVRATMSGGGGSLTSKGGGKYIVRVSSGKEATINVSADLGGGRTRSMGSQKFRIKPIPPPVPTVAGKTGGGIRKGVVKGAPYVVATLKGFVFEGVKFKIISYKFSTVGSGNLLEEAPVRGARLTGRALSLLQKARSNQKIFFEDIKAKGPDGRVRNIGSLIFKLQ